MKSTWIGLGIVVAAGAWGYAKLRAKADEAPLARMSGPQASDAKPRADASTPAPSEAGTKPAETPAVPVVADEAEARAQSVVLQARARLEAHDAPGAAALERDLDGALRDTSAARRHALERGVAAMREAEGRPAGEAVILLDRARRDLSRGLFLEEMFDRATGKPSEARKELVAAIARANARVMTWPAGLEGVTRPHVVRAGESPVAIVTREKLPYGHDAILFWNHGGNLDPTRLRAGETLLLPLEPVTVRVSLARRLLGVYVGDALAREFEVGVGAACSPTPPGDYVVGDKQLNPDWHPPGGRTIKYGDPRNELGDAWIAIGSPEHPTGYGIHGTNRPETVGTECSHGCVRLANAEAVEVYWWVRTGRAGGTATRVTIR
jgi:lipoprotein-anchoring transpeptidase ErfK/SrfK